MNTAADLIQRCQRDGIRLFPNGDRLRVIGAPGKPLAPELLDTLKAHKQAVMAALACEDAAEYVAERAAICAADGLPPAHLRPVFEYILADDPRVRLIMLGIIEQTLEQATASLQDRFGAARLLSVTVYQWPPAPAVLQ